MALLPEEAVRYSRHTLLPEIGVAGQERLRDSSVLLIGAGGLGSPLALYLAAAGVGRIGIVDADVVDLSNLQRQVLHETGGVGRLKVESARERLHALNPDVDVVVWDEPFTSGNAFEIARGFDVLVDGTDNFPTRYLSNDVAVWLGIPNVYGSIHRFEGQVSVFAHRDGPCYRCLYPAPPPPGLVPTCAEGGVLGVLPGVIGTLQATEALKLLLGIGEPLVGRLLIYDALGMRMRELRFDRDLCCPVCGEHPTITEPVDYEGFCGVSVLQPSSSSTTNAMPIPEITVEELRDLREQGAPHTLIDVREQNEYDAANLGGTLIPLSQLPGHLDAIPKEGRVIVHCRSGARSARAIEYLQSQGWTNLANLAGGIHAWSDRIDPTLPKP